MALLATASYANSVPNGFAYDDIPLLETNPVVQDGRVSDAVWGPYWELEPGVGRLYRPVTLADLVVEWSSFGPRPAWFHGVNVVLHVGVSLFVLALAFRLMPLSGAILAASLFAVHPVHVEAVANVAGRPELLAALFFLAACVLFLRPAPTPARRAVRLAGVSLLYLLALGSKEIAVTLPAVLLVLGWLGGREADGRAREARPRVGTLLRREAVLLALMALVLVTYLVLRFDALGSIVGEELPAELYGATRAQSLLTALTLWPHYARLLLFPLDLSVEYGPPLLGLVTGPTLAVLAGALILVVIGASLLPLVRRAPASALGLAWFLVTVAPLTHIGVHAGVLLAERTLYLPSVGVCLALGAAGAAVARSVAGPAARRWTAFGAGLAVALLMARTVLRNPTWESTFSVMNTLGLEHPESHRALRSRAEGDRRAGAGAEALDAYRRAVALLPYRYDLLTEAGAFLRDRGELGEAEDLLERATEVAPGRRAGWRLLAEVRLRRREGREAHRAAVEGLRRVGWDPLLFRFLSESYVLRDDLAGAVRAREASFGGDAAGAATDARLRELRDALRARAGGAGGGR